MMVMIEAAEDVSAPENVQDSATSATLM